MDSNDIERLKQDLEDIKNLKAFPTIHTERTANPTEELMAYRGLVTMMKDSIEVVLKDRGYFND